MPLPRNDADPRNGDPGGNGAPQQREEGGDLNRENDPEQPFDVFIVHTGAQKWEIAMPLKEVLEENIGYQLPNGHRRFRCFVDAEMAPRHGPPLVQMEKALETCRS